ncbi:MAG: OFA family MFS transporter [Patescibacteria group bacterium]|nr:OFA family MFS transporter [Patescibacteria group bacterium]
MVDGRVMNRWLVVLGAILIQLCLGAIYAWSVFTPALTKAPYNFTATQTQWIFGVGLAVFAIVMIVAGRMQAKFPPRNVAMAGGVVLGLGYVAASFMGTSFLGHLICLGVIGGSGIGLGYVVPIAVGVKWFPDKKGMLTGLAVAGFGFGALLWVKLAGSWGNLIESFGIANVFLMYGIAFAAIVLVGSTWMVNPPAGWKPEGWEPPAPSPGNVASGAINLSSSEMLRTPQFYMLWAMFAAGAMAGLMVIGCITLFGIDALRSTGLTEVTAQARAGTAFGLFFALANGLGRIGWGIISDKIGRKASLFTMFLIQGTILLLFYQMGFNAWTLYLGSAVIGFNFGGNFALFPAATADCFGNKQVGTNYGWVFTSYGVGGIVGPVLGGHFRDVAKSAADLGGGQIDPSAWSTPFIIAGVACLVAAALALALRSPKA